LYIRSEANGLSLNKEKCGILQVVGPRSIPYAGAINIWGSTYIDNRLGVQHHIDVVKPKVNYLVRRLKWIPRKMTSLKLRHNLWTVFIQPLVELCMMFRIV